MSPQLLSERRPWSLKRLKQRVVVVLLRVQLVAEKEFLITMLTTSHDLHLLRIDTREDALVRTSNDWVTNMIDDMHDRVEMRRNRERITEILHFIERQRRDADEIENQEIIQPVVSEDVLQQLDSGSVQPVGSLQPTLHAADHQQLSETVTDDTTSAVVSFAD